MCIGVAVKAEVHKLLDFTRKFRQ